MCLSLSRDRLFRIFDRWSRNSNAVQAYWDNNILTRIFFFFEVRQFLKFVEFYCQFIHKFDIIIELLSDLLKKSENEKIYRSFLIINETRKAFNILKKNFIIAFILIHFDSKRKIMIETNVSRFDLAEILSQLKKNTNQWHLVTFFSRKMSVVERNYAMSKQKMLTIVKCCWQWRYYVKDAIHSICVIIDYNNLQKFFHNKVLNRREAKRWKKFSRLNVVIKWRFDKSNSTDDLSKKFNCEVKARSALDSSKTQELQKTIILKINEWISKFMRKIENDNILSISKSINSIKTSKQEEKSLQFFWTRKSLMNRVKHSRMTLSTLFKLKTLSRARRLISSTRTILIKVSWQW